MVLLSSYKCNRGKIMINENIIEIITEFLDFLKEKEDDSKEKEVEVMTTEDDEDTDEDDDDFDKELVKISRGE